MVYISSISCTFNIFNVLYKYLSIVIGLVLYNVFNVLMYVHIDILHLLQLLTRAVTRALIGEGGGCIYIYSCSALLISFEINCYESCYQLTNMHPPI